MGISQPVPLITGPKTYNAVINGGVDNSGVKNVTTALQSAYTAAVAGGYENLYLPAGTYSVNLATGNLFSVAANGFQIFGDGAGLTKIVQANNTSLTGSVNFFDVTGRAVYIHDMTINGGTGNTSQTVASATVPSGGGGSGYTVGDQITINAPGGLFYQNSAVILTVATLGASNSVATVTVTQAGSWSLSYSPTIGGTGGTGSGATFNLTWNSAIYGQSGINADYGSFDGLFEQMELTNIYGGSTGGGTAVGVTALWNAYEYCPTAGGSISAGAFALVTPSSIQGISIGRRVDVDTGVSSPQVQWMNTSYPRVALQAQPNAPGSGYVVGDVVTTSGGTGTQATFVVGALRVVSATYVAAGTGYIPNDLLAISGGTISAGPLGGQVGLKVASTQVVSATVAAGGSGGSNGTQTVTGTTGTGTKFTASVTVSGGAITAVLSITSGGSYTTNPTTLTNEPVTGASLLGAALSVVMGVNTLSVPTPGSYSTTPGAGTLSTTDSTTAAASGCTVTLTYGADQLGSYQATGYASISAAGSGYAINDLIPLTGGTFGYPAIFRVLTINSSGGVTSLQQVSGGTYSAAPSTSGAATGTAINAKTGVSSSGSSCAINLNSFAFFNGPAATSGLWASTAPTNPVTMNNGSGSSLTANVQFGPESIIVLGNTPSSFIGWFQQAHSSSAYLGVLARGTGQHHLFRDIYIHDCFSCTGIGGTGSGCVFDKIRVSNVGAISTQHGVYWQGANSRFDRGQFEGCSGFSIQIQQSSPNVDGSWNVVNECTSVNPGSGHVVTLAAQSPEQIIGAWSDNANPDVTLGSPLQRGTIISKNIFRCTNQQATYPINGVNIQSTAIVTDNIFEDAGGLVGGGTWIFLQSAYSAGSKIAGNKFSFLNTIGPTTCINAGGSSYCTIERNDFYNVSGSGTIVAALGAYSTFRNNAVVLASNYGGAGSSTANVITVASTSPNVEVGSNVFYGATVTSNQVSIFNPSASGFRFHDNYINAPSGFVVNGLSNSVYGSFYNNDWTNSRGLRLGSNTPNYATVVYNNDGGVNNGGVTETVLGRACGRLLHAITGSGGVTHNLCVKWSGSGDVVLCTTSDTAFVGIAISDNSSGTWVMIAGQPNTEFITVAVDAAWTIGNVGILSSTSGGKIHDTGSTSIPSAGTSYVVFLDTGGGAGTSRVQVLRTTG